MLLVCWFFLILCPHIFLYDSLTLSTFTHPVDTYGHTEYPRCPRLWLRTIAGKSTCGGSVAFPWEVHPKGGNYDLVVGEDHMLGPSCQRYNWQTGRCGSIAFGSSPRRGKTLISNPRCLAEVFTCGKDFRR